MALDIATINSLDLKEANDQDTMAALIDGAYKQNNSYVNGLARTWDINIRFYEGNQWIYYDETTDTTMPLPVIEGKTDFIPRPVTNYIAPITWTIASVFTKNKPTALVLSNSDDDADRTASRISESVLDTKWELDKEQQLHVDAILIALNCGTVIRKDYWDPTKESIEVDDGEGGRVQVGDTAVEMLSPFEVYYDINGGAYAMQASVENVQEIKRMYSVDKPGYTGLTDEIEANKDYSNTLRLREQLRTLTKSNGNSSSYSSDFQQQDTAVLVECYLKPTEAYPNGLMVVECNGVPLYINESPYFDPKVDDSWHPYTFFKWQVSPLKWHGISLVEQLVPLQRRINGIDSIIQLANMTTVNPVWMVPKSCQVPKGFFNGRPGLEVHYADNPNGPAPQRLPGISLSNSVYEERKQKLEDMHFIAGDNLVLHGNQPSGVNTATGLQLLLEQSASKFNPYYTNWEKFIEGGQQKKLLMISKMYIENRPDFVEKLKKFSSRGTNVDIKMFLGADLRDNIQVRIEAGSSIPRSKLVEQQQLMDLAKMGLLGDISPQGNPLANQELLAKFGVRQFDGVTNPDLVKANYVISVLKQINEGKLSAEDYPNFLPFEDVNIHMDRLIDEMKKPEFSDNKGVFDAKFKELNEVKEVRDAALQEQQMMAQMGGMPMPPEGMPQPGPEQQMPPMPDQGGVPMGEMPLPIDQPI